MEHMQYIFKIKLISKSYTYRKTCINPIVHGGRSKFTPLVGFFLITFFSRKLRTWNFLTLSFYPLEIMWRNFIKNMDLFTNYDTFVINDWKLFAKKNFFSYKHTSVFFISRFFIHSHLQLYFSYFCKWQCQKSNYQYWHFFHE